MKLSSAVSKCSRPATAAWHCSLESPSATYILKATSADAWLLARMARHNEIAVEKFMPVMPDWSISKHARERVRLSALAKTGSDVPPESSRQY